MNFGALKTLVCQFGRIGSVLRKVVCTKDYQKSSQYFGQRTGGMETSDFLGQYNEQGINKSTGSDRCIVEAGPGTCEKNYLYV
jgi:hypothetical protein